MVEVFWKLTASFWKIKSCGKYTKIALGGSNAIIFNRYWTFFDKHLIISGKSVLCCYWKKFWSSYHVFCNQRWWTIRLSWFTFPTFIFWMDCCKLFVISSYSMRQVNDCCSRFLFLIISDFTTYAFVVFLLLDNLMMFNLLL